MKPCEPGRPWSAPSRRVRFAAGWATALLALNLALGARAAIQFDVFLGYGSQPTGADGIVREAGWFSVGCEVFNDGPSFNGIFEVSNSEGGQGQTRRLALELPTNTRKRFVIPAFSSGSGAWRARLMDDRGRVRAEHDNLHPRALASESLLVGAIPRTFGGTPRLPNLRGNNANSPMQPLVARLPVEQVPEDPISLEGLDALYLNSEKALELKAPQADALNLWVRAGGHLVVAVEQPSEVNATTWLQSLLPCTVTGVVPVKATREVQDWLQGVATPAATNAAPGPNRFQPPRPVLPPGADPRILKRYGLTGVPTSEPAPGEDPFASLVLDPAFEQVEFPVATGTLRDAEVRLACAGVPLIVTAPRGRGRVTALLFSPEREPFRSWNQREWFWARLFKTPASWYASSDLPLYGGHSVDGVFGVMIDSRQVRKLPVRWLLLLLFVYLVVIGPLDQYWLKRLNRQMLTWVTFPAYVVLFSLLIYYIGYRLRAGETEWNELHVVDVLPRGTSAELRGRTFASVYSPVNARYPLSSELEYGTVRGEFMGAYFGPGKEGSRAEVVQEANGFKAQVYVPVWTSQLFVSDWVSPADLPFTVELASGEGGLRVVLTNHAGAALKDLRLVTGERIYELGEVADGGRLERRLEPAQGTPLSLFVQNNSGMFAQAVQQRNQAFGSPGFPFELDPVYLSAISFLARASTDERPFLSPPGVDLNGLLERGDAVLLAWVPGHAPVPSMRRFNASRVSRNTMLRLAIPADQVGHL